MKIGISLASLLPWSAYWPLMAANLAKEMGYEFLQILPFRGVTSGFIDESPLPISFCERAWNPGSFGAVMQGKITKDPTAPQLHDWLFFPDELESEQIYQHFLEKRIIPITHDVNDLGEKLVEVYPGLWLTPAEIIQRINEKKCLVLDLYHLRRQPRPDEIVLKPQYILGKKSLLGEWQTSLSLLMPYANVIHISPSRDYDEMSEFLQGSDTILEKMLKIIQESGYDGDFVVEVTIGLKGLYLGLFKKILTAFLLKVRTILQ